MPVFGKDSEVYDAIQDLRAAVKALEDETGITKKKEDEAKAAEEAAAKAAEDEAKASEEAEKQTAAPSPASAATQEKASGAPKETAATHIAPSKK